MKKFFMLIFILFSLIILFGCTDTNNVSMVNDKENVKKESLKYDIEQILFSKSFQSMEPIIEVIESDDNNIKLLGHLGLSDYSAVEIDKIVLEGNEINIHVSGTKKDREKSLSVPQVIINLNKDKLENIEDTKFNIVYEDFTPVKIKFKINDILNKMESYFKLSPKSSPRFDLVNIDNNIVWEITYSNIFYTDSEDTTLINLSALVDANSGDILNSNKNIISSTLDVGHILNYAQNEILLYKQVENHEESNKVKEQLYTYDIINEDKILLYTSNYKILSGEVSSDLKNISFIETSENGNEVYITPHDKPKVYKIVFENDFNPNIIKWKDNDVLYILGQEKNNSSMYTYDLKNNELSLVSKFNKEVESFSVLNDYFLIVEKSDNDYNKKIFLTENLKLFKPINDGFNPRFIDNTNIAYITKDENSNINYLSIYNLDENKVIRKIDRNVVSYYVSDNSIVYIKNNPSYNDFTLFDYSIEDKKISQISHLVGENAYYNRNDNIIYLNVTLPFESDNTEMIYSISLDDIKNP